MYTEFTIDPPTCRGCRIRDTAIEILADRLLACAAPLAPQEWSRKLRTGYARGC